MRSERAALTRSELLEAADWKFYDIDPMLFSPADVTLTSAESGRARPAGDAGAVRWGWRWPVL